MESHNLYRVKEEDLDKLIRILTVCFSEDPLYHALIPDRDTRDCSERLQNNAIIFSSSISYSLSSRSCMSGQCVCFCLPLLTTLM